MVIGHLSGFVERPNPYFNPVADPPSHQTSIFDSHQLASFEFPRGWHHGMAMLSRNAGKSLKWSTHLPSRGKSKILMGTCLCFGQNLPLTPNWNYFDMMRTSPQVLIYSFVPDKYTYLLHNREYARN